MTKTRSLFIIVVECLIVVCYLCIEPIATYNLDCHVAQLKYNVYRQIKAQIDKKNVVAIENLPRVH